MVTLARTSTADLVEPDSFRLELVGNVYHLWEEQVGCDLEILVRGQSWFAHKLVLMAQSSYFRAMFSDRFSEKDMSAIDLSEVFEEVSHLKMVLRYIYSGQATLTEENIVGVLHASSHLLLDGLKEHCSEFLLTNLCPEKCLPSWVLADRYSLPELLKAAGDILRTWLNFDQHLVTEVGRSPNSVLQSLQEGGLFSHLLSHTPGYLLTAIEKHLDQDPSTRNTFDGLKGFFEGQSNPCKNVWNLHPPNAGDVNLPNTEDVLLACFSPRLKAEQMPNAIELHAFVPRENTWRKVLSHSLPPGSHMNERMELLGLGRDKAYFLPYFYKERHNYPEVELSPIYAYCILSKTLKTIHRPRGYLSLHYLANAFIHDDSLCLIVKDLVPTQQSAWTLMRYDARQEKWVEMCSIPVPSRDAFFCVRGCRESVYIWSLEVFDFEATSTRNLWIEVRRVDSDDVQYQARQLAAPPALPPNCLPDSEDGTGPFIYGLIRSISQKSEAGEIRVCVKIESSVHIQHDLEWPFDGVCYRALTYDCNTDAWAEEECVHLPHPKVAILDPAKLPKCWHEDRLPCQNKTLNFWPTESEEESRFDEAPWHQIWNTTPEKDIGVGRYFAKTTSPYTSDFYLMRPWEKKWERLSSLPFTADHFSYMRECEVSMDVVETWPLSTFTDYSPEVGQSGFLWWLLNENKEEENNWFMKKEPNRKESILEFKPENLLSSSGLTAALYAKWLKQ